MPKLWSRIELPNQQQTGSKNQTGKIKAQENIKTKPEIKHENTSLIFYFKAYYKYQILIDHNTNLGN